MTTKTADQKIRKYQHQVECNEITTLQPYNSCARHLLHAMGHLGCSERVLLLEKLQAGLSLVLQGTHLVFMTLLQVLVFPVQLVVAG